MSAKIVRRAVISAEIGPAPRWREVRHYECATNDQIDRSNVWTLLPGEMGLNTDDACAECERPLFDD